MTPEEFVKKYAAPFDHCSGCPYKESGKCKVAGKYQRLPRYYRGALAQCIFIGGKGM